MRTLVPNASSMPFFKWLDIRLLLILISSIGLFVSVARANDATLPLPDNVFGIIKDQSLVLHIDAVEIGNYEVLINGKQYKGGYKPHEMKNLHVYNLSELRNSTFFVHDFIVDGETLSGKFDSIAAWLTHLNKHSQSQWSWDEKRGLLYGGNENARYNNFSITKASSDGVVLVFPINVVSIAKSLMIDLPSNITKVTITHILSGEKITKDFKEEILANNP